MAAIVISGDTSGTVALNAPAVAGTQSYTLPTALPTASGAALTATTAGVMSWAAGSSGTVTSVGLSAPALFTVTGSPVTSSGTLAIAYSGTALPVANGGTNATSAGITAFNNITGYTASGATGTTSTNLVFSTTPTLTNPTVTNYVETSYVATAGTSVTIDLANGTFQRFTISGGNATITTPTAVAGKSFILILTQDSTPRTVTWTTVVWPSGTAPTISTGSGKRDIFSFFSDGTSWFGATIGQNY